MINSNFVYLVKDLQHTFAKITQIFKPKEANLPLSPLEPDDSRVAAANLAVLCKITGFILDKIDPKTSLFYKMMPLGSSAKIREKFIDFEF